MPVPNPAALEIFSRCGTKTDDLIAGSLGQERTPQRMRQVVTDINGFADAYIASFQQDYRAQGGGNSACQAGCAFCCHGPIHLTPVETLNIAMHLASPAVSTAQRAIWCERISARSVKMRGMAVSAQIGVTIPCAFLLENQCSIYTVRPLFCRGRNSFDVLPCREGYADPTREGNFEILQEQTLVGQCLVMGILAALQKINLPNRCLDLCLSMEVALNTPTVTQRWLDGENLLWEGCT